MSTQDNSNHNRRRGAYIGVKVLVLLALPLFGSEANADEARSWRPQPALDVRTATYFEYSGGASMTAPAIGAELSIDLSPPELAIAGGLFADYELTSNEAGKHSRLVGGWVRYRYGRWKLSTVAAHFESGHVSGLWMHASKLQFELRPGHKLALEAIGKIRGGGDPALQLVYNTYLSEYVSVSIKIGVGSNRMRDVGASTKFVWSVF